MQRHYLFVHTHLLATTSVDQPQFATSLAAKTILLFSQKSTNVGLELVIHASVISSVWNAGNAAAQNAVLNVVNALT